MQLAQFVIPIADNGQKLEECNRFLRSVKVVEIDRQFTVNDGAPCWSILVHYLESVEHDRSKTKKPKVDYRDILNGEDFQQFSELRKDRKLLAERDGVPVYAVFTNEQLATVVTSKITTPAELGKVNGVGAARVEKYQDILKRMQNYGK